MSKDIKIEHAVKRYGDLTIIKDLSTQIRNGELFTLLGPSGCGKTTLLRMIAGFNSIEGGTISFSDKIINHIPAHKRNIGMVFQDYAIFPHLTVEENVQYGLKEHKIEKEEAARRLENMLKLTKIDIYRDRLPENLSGGQQQRVALARAIAIYPDVLLMDEPLCNLDAKLRVEMRSVIRDIQKEIGITTVYVTHDQEEALAISDRIAVMNGGDIQQVACPHTIYTRPYNMFVADFIGHTGFMYATLSGKEKNRTLDFSNGYKVKMNNIRKDAVNGKVVVGVRPEEFCVSDKSEGIKGKIEKTTYLGKYIIYFVKFEDLSFYEGNQIFEISQDLGSATDLFKDGDFITFNINEQKINVFDPDTGISIIDGVEQNEA